MKRILLVDDEADFREALRQVLEFVGHEVIEADGARQALVALDGVRPGDYDVFLERETFELGEGHLPQLGAEPVSTRVGKAEVLPGETARLELRAPDSG